VGGRRSCRLVEEVKNITIVYNVKHYFNVIVGRISLRWKRIVTIHHVLG
jgi:hypothetical protein